MKTKIKTFFVEKKPKEGKNKQKHINIVKLHNKKGTQTKIAEVPDTCFEKRS